MVVILIGIVTEVSPTVNAMSCRPVAAVNGVTRAEEVLGPRLEARMWGDGESGSHYRVTTVC